MPPRKSRQLAAGTNSTPGDATPRTSARLVYDIPEIRGKILQLLPKPTLAVFMRVEKGVLADVARVLYYSMPFDHVKNQMKVSTARGKVYLAAVTEVNARNLFLTPSMMKDIDYKGSGAIGTQAARIKRYLRTFHLEIFHLLIPLLIKKCCNLRRIFFGSAYSALYNHSWVVHLDRSDDPAKTSPSGRIDMIRSVEIPLLSDIPTAISATPLIPPPGFTFSHSYDISFALGRGVKSIPDEKAETWLRAIREGSLFADLATTLDFSILPVTLDDLALVVQRSTSQTIRRITARRLISFEIKPFRAFAAGATSLTRLVLVDSGWPVTSFLPQQALDFSDLPDFVDIVRQSLRNMVELDLAVKGIAAAEKGCLTMLAGDCLERGGSIRKLQISTGAAGPPYFNSLRLLSTLSDWRDKDVAIAVRQHGSSDSTRSQTEYVRYLRGQPINRRAFLSTIDFSSLGITTLSEVLDLTYHPDGRPHNLSEGKAMKWALSAGPAAKDAQANLLPQLQLGMQEITDASTRLRTTMTTASPEERLAEVKKLLAAVDKVREVGALVQDAVGAVGSEQELRDYVKALEQQVGRR